MARVLAALALALVWAQAASAGQSPAGVQDAVLAAAGAQKSVHYVSKASAGGITITQVADVAADRGIQRITCAANGTTGHLTVLVVRREAYVRGDEFALVHCQGLSQGDARSYAGAWVHIPRGSPLYAGTAADVTLASLVGDLRLGGSLSARAGVVSARGTVSGTLTYASGGKPLPMKEVVRAPNGGGATIALSRWNENVAVSAPASSRTLGPTVTA